MKPLVLCGAVLALASIAAARQDGPAPLLSATEVGAQRLPDLRFERHAARRTFYVAPSGSDTNPGTARQPWRTLGKAAGALQAGDQALVRAGTYREQIVTGNAGKAEAPIRLGAAPGSGGKVRLAGAVPGKPFIRITQPYWIVEGFEIDAEAKHDPAKDAWQPAVAFDRTHHALVRKIHAHHGSGPSVFSIAGSREVAVLDCRIHDNKEWFREGNRNQDCHGVLLLPGTERVLIRGNRSWGNGGDSIHCLGPEDAEGTPPARDITIENNQFGPPPAERGARRDVENAVDLKTCTGVTIRGNRCWGYRPSPYPPPNNAPGGFAFIVHRNADRVLIERNQVRDCGGTLSVGNPRLGTVGVVVFRRNRVADASTEAGSLGIGMRANGARIVEVYGNTFSALPGAAVRLAEDGPITERAVVRDNQVERAGSAPRLIRGAQPIARLFSDW